RRLRHGHRARRQLDLRTRTPAGGDPLPAHALQDVPVGNFQLHTAQRPMKTQRTTSKTPKARKQDAREVVSFLGSFPLGSFPLGSFPLGSFCFGCFAAWKLGVRWELGVVALWS